MGYIHVGDGSMLVTEILVTVLAILDTNVNYIFTLAPTFKRCHQLRNSVNKIQKLAPTVSHQHQDVTNITVTLLVALLLNILVRFDTLIISEDFEIFRLGRRVWISDFWWRIKLVSNNRGGTSELI